MELVFKTEKYEGPLDLLLTLISKNKMSIFDIRISELFEQYMAYVGEMQRLDMEIAGEFITMAAELMYIKSKMLLPKPEEEDPRQELVRKLMEYTGSSADVSDPWYTRDFDRCYKDIYAGCEALLNSLI